MKKSKKWVSASGLYLARLRRTQKQIGRLLRRRWSPGSEAERVYRTGNF